jgi:hypothetical protein
VIWPGQSVEKETQDHFRWQEFAKIVCEFFQRDAVSPSLVLCDVWAGKDAMNCVERCSCYPHLFTVFGCSAFWSGNGLNEIIHKHPKEH